MKFLKNLYHEMWYRLLGSRCLCTLTNDEIKTLSDTYNMYLSGGNYKEYVTQNDLLEYIIPGLGTVYFPGHPKWNEENWNAWFTECSDPLLAQKVRDYKTRAEKRYEKQMQDKARRCHCPTHRNSD